MELPGCSWEIDTVKFCPTESSTMIILTFNNSESIELIQNWLKTKPFNGSGCSVNINPGEVVNIESFEFDEKEDSDVKMNMLNIKSLVETPSYKEGTCPKCGHQGNWINMALVCPVHGTFAG